MKHIFIIPILSLICVTAAAQYKPQTGTPYHVGHIVGPTKNKVKTMVEFRDNDGKASPTATKYVFNIDGTLAAKITMVTQEYSDSYHVLRYQWSNGKLTSITSSDGVPIKLVHDSKGNLIKEIIGNRHDMAIEYSYNSENLLIESFDGECIYYYWEYENGILTSMGWDGVDGGDTFVCENGLIVKGTGDDCVGERDYESTYTYTFNEFNDWGIMYECIIYYDEYDYDKITSINHHTTIRKFTYYD